MCGIAGYVDLKGQTPGERLEATARAMAETMRHRGPDDGGVWSAPQAGVALASRRLAVRDLSPAGHQPMASEDGRHVLVYNGEIYDIDGLRGELRARGRRFMGDSDSEVLLHACAEWGPEKTVKRLNGMFAFAFWDGDRRTLTLARDRLGIKPLYWAETDGLFLFGSELKALGAHPDWRPELDRDALAAYSRLSYVPAPRCIWRGAHKLEPGTVLTLGAGKTGMARYWNMAAIAAQERTPATMQDAADGLEALLRKAVGRRLVSDVPLGVFLSGGVDSAVVAALAQAQRADPLKTFTVGFAEADYDEAADAAKVAAHLGCDHASLTVSAEEARACIPELPRWFDEPFADSSQIPTLLISRFARQSVTVALSGDGGDEVFGGYNRYAFAARHWPLLRRLPAPARRLAAVLIAALPPRLWDRALGGMVRQAGEKAHKLAAVLPMDGLDQVYRLLTWQGMDASGLVRGATEPPIDAAIEAPAFLEDAVERMQFMDTAGYLPDDILT
ncbi:MAG: asparagine synthase (glutamine-hydrolyzing), partial [Rhodospirillales bacterium]|nr:asparagine synthase (glutamine-hydrolyzing) [Rhodospirillales bacterium]